MCYNLAIKWGMQMKIKGKTNLKTSNEVVINNKEFNGLKNDNTITFYDDGIKVHITLGEEVILKRSNDDYEIMLTFNERSRMEGKYLSKKDNLFLPLYIITDKIIVGNNLLIINYRLNDEIYEFKLEFEVI